MYLINRGAMLRRQIRIKRLSEMAGGPHLLQVVVVVLIQRVMLLVLLQRERVVQRGLALRKVQALL